MIVGFTITDYLGHEEDAIEFIRAVCILDSPEIANNIVKAGTGMNIYTNNVTEEMLEEQPFEAEPISTIDGTSMVISNVNYILELPYNDGVMRLLPTEFKYIDPDDEGQFEEYLKWDLIKIISGEGGGSSDWILISGSWNDNGVWVDNEVWRD